MLPDQREITVSAVLHPPLPPTNLYFMSITRIHAVKSGPFHEHSSQLYSIATGVQYWTKVHTGLFKMYEVRPVQIGVLVSHRLTYRIRLKGRSTRKTCGGPTHTSRRPARMGPTTRSTRKFYIGTDVLYFVSAVPHDGADVYANEIPDAESCIPPDLCCRYAARHHLSRSHTVPHGAGSDAPGTHSKHCITTDCWAHWRRTRIHESAATASVESSSESGRGSVVPFS